MARPSDEEHALAAARHVFEKPDAELAQRVGELSGQGVHDETTLAKHALETMTAPDTQCFRGAHGRESYANDRMNTIVHSWEGKSEANSVFYNSERDGGGRSATERLAVMAERERTEYPEASCDIRTGGSRALEGDRERERSAASEKRPLAFPPPPPEPPPPSQDDSQSQGRGR